MKPDFLKSARALVRGKITLEQLSDLDTWPAPESLDDRREICADILLEYRDIETITLLVTSHCLLLKQRAMIQDALAVTPRDVFPANSP